MFIRINEVIRLTGMSRSAIYLGISERRFPAQIKIGKRSVAWDHADIQKWMEEMRLQR